MAVSLENGGVTGYTSMVSDKDPGAGPRWRLEALLAERGLLGDRGRLVAQDARARASDVFGRGDLEGTLERIAGRAAPSADPRRRHDRYALRRPVQIHAPGWGDLVELWTRDISHGGVFVHADHLPQLRERVQIRLVIGGSIKISIEGEVVYVVTPEDAARRGIDAGFGVAFVNVSPQRKAQLQQLVDAAAHSSNLAQAGARALNWEASASSSCWRMSLSDDEARQVDDLRKELLGMGGRSDAQVLGVGTRDDQAATRRALLEVGEPWYRLATDPGVAPESRTLALAIIEQLEAAAHRLAEAQSGCAEGARPDTTYRWVAPPRRARAGSATSPATGPATPEPSSPSVAGRTPPSQGRAVRLGGGGAATRPVVPGAAVTDPSAARQANSAGQASPPIPEPVPQTVTTQLLSEAVASLRAREWEQAVAQLAQVIAHGHDDPQLGVLQRLAQARLCLQRKDPRGAVAHYEAILAVDPEHAMARRELLVALCMTG